ncbi:thioredoxin-related transmembrane protein 1-like [Dreissena polymorpha]|uniref:Thioredoxin domain-containing protein n=1 Tax=Dreissena polymorpha TaxID=45954 RepID=A0A9D4BW16_DREPO|nr:thioredoxin-related transmembrane protein 1-like [Dreissena polymorpha]KAH3712115.1 hypothetical protein DPMN_071794 [Dreissena polymorpha]
MSTVLSLMCVLFMFSAVRGGNYQPRAIQLTEETWPDILEGEWMVEFMAPWCPACQSFQSTWDGFAQKWSRDLDVKVATVDVTVNPGLSGRFLITALPSIYHVKKGVFRQYLGGRQETDLITYIDDKKWQDVQPVSKWLTPDSIQMGLVGLFFKFAMKIRGIYTMMTDDYGIPEWGCYVIFAVLTIIAGLALGLLLVCICDHMGPSRQYPLPKDLMGPELDKDGDLIDDTQTADGDETVRRRKVSKDAGDNSENGEEESEENDTENEGENEGDATQKPSDSKKDN